MHRLFEVQELVSMICAHQPLSNAALVSKTFFRGMVPHLWEDTKGVTLFERGLIPATLIREHGKLQIVRTYDLFYRSNLHCTVRLRVSFSGEHGAFPFLRTIHQVPIGF
jgi:hypothetical protein